MSNCVRPARRNALHLTTSRALCLTGLLALVLLNSTGCALMRSLAYQTAPQSDKIDPEFAGLTGHKAVVYVWAKPESMWDYPQLRLDLDAYISAYLKEHVKDVEIVAAPQVENYVKSLSTMNPDPAEIGRQFHADMVVHVSIYRLSMRDPGLSQFYRGRISGSVVVLDLTNKDGTVKRTPLQDVSVVVPEDGPLGYHNASADQVRDTTYREFTQTVGRKFHEWEKERK